MSTCFWGVKENAVYEESYSKVLKNIEKSKFNIEVEEVKGRYRLKTDISSMWTNLDDKEKKEILDSERVLVECMNRMFKKTKVFDEEKHTKGTHYSWLDIRTNESDEEMVYGLTRYCGNSGHIAHFVLMEVLNCSDTVCEHDEIERLVEVGVYDPSVLEDEDEEEVA